MIKGVLISISVLLFLAFVIIIISCVIEYKDNYFSSRTRLKFKSFLKFYELCPKNWELYCNYPIYQNCTDVSFNFLDYYRYKIWKKRIDKRTAKIAQLKSQEQLIQYIQKDIDKMFGEIAEINKTEAIKIHKIMDRHNGIVETPRTKEEGELYTKYLF